MKRTKHLVSLFAALALSVCVQAQSQSSEEKEKQELRQKFQRGMQARRIEHAQAREVAIQSNKYNHHEDEIIAKLNSIGIPDDFPVYKAEYTDDQYVGIMNQWYKEHPERLRNPVTNQPK